MTDTWYMIPGEKHKIVSISHLPSIGCSSYQLHPHAREYSMLCSMCAMRPCGVWSLCICSPVSLRGTLDTRYQVGINQYLVVHQSTHTGVECRATEERQISSNLCSLRDTARNPHDLHLYCRFTYHTMPV